MEGRREERKREREMSNILICMENVWGKLNISISVSSHHWSRSIMLLCHLLENFRTSCFITHTDTEGREEKYQTLPQIVPVFLFVGESLRGASVLMSSCKNLMGVFCIASSCKSPLSCKKRQQQRWSLNFICIFSVSSGHQPDTVTLLFKSTPFLFVFFLLSFWQALHLTQSHLLRAPALQHSPCSSYRCLGICRKRTKRERNEGRMKEHRQVSDICADSAPAAALSNDPDSVDPGRDYNEPAI